ncbi:F-box only protein 39-like [Pagrus major]|uniref:F-box only protein 39-like n=1 Tax=Pagrus major TaxID=143350 RepID=UPI003CC8E0C2
MDKEIVPVANREGSPQEEDYGGEDDSDLSDERPESISSSLATLPDLCLIQVFSFLPYRDRRSANLVCHHWHHVMRSPSLWRYHFFFFNGWHPRSRSECSAVAYARSLGVYLERLEVRVWPPARAIVAQRLQVTISRLFSELTRVQAPLRSLTLTGLELDRTCWVPRLRNSLIDCLIRFLHRRASKLTSVSLNGMQNSMSQGLHLLYALSHSQGHHDPPCYISSLDLRGFFSNTEYVSLNSNLPHVLLQLQGLTNLSMSYSYLSSLLLTALQDRHRGKRWRDGKTLQTFSLHCAVNEPHHQLVSSDSWATLASSCPNLNVGFTVNRAITPSCFMRILLPEIPLTEFSMSTYFFFNPNWSARPLLCDMLPQYRRCLQHLNLDLINRRESIDEELLELVEMCECLERLSIRAFLDMSTLARLLHIRLSQRSSLNKIKVTIYSVSDNIAEKEEQLTEILSSHRHLPHQLDFFAMVKSMI